MFSILFFLYSLVGYGNLILKTHIRVLRTWMTALELV